MSRQYAAASIVVLALVGCRAREAAPAGPSHRPPPVDIDTRLAEAVRVHEAHFKLDYKRPFERAAIGDSPATGLYLDACRSGRKQACWIAEQIAYQDAIIRDPLTLSPRSPTGTWRDAVQLVEANCMAGDKTSCIALPVVDDAFGVTFPRARGAIGRSLACRDAAETCREGAVQDECAAGFDYSCRALADVLQHRMEQTNQDLMKDVVAALKRARELGTSSCAERIMRSCIVDDAPADKRFEVTEQFCALSRRCSFLADEYLARGDTARARDAAERGCQFFLDRCAELGVMYLDGKLPEPTPGRGQALVDWVCASMQRSLGDNLMRTYAPCARARL